MLEWHIKPSCLPAPPGTEISLQGVQAKVNDPGAGVRTGDGYYALPSG